MSFEKMRLRMADGTEYGPISVDELDQWIREGRVPNNAVVVDQVTGETRPAHSGRTTVIPPTPIPPSVINAPLPTPQTAAAPPSPRVSAAEYWQALGSLKVTGLASIGWAVPNTVFGLMSISDGHFSGWVQLIIGILLAVDGSCLMATMSPNMLVLDGVLFLFCAFWNIVIGLFPPISILMIVLGAGQVYWGLQSFGKKKMLNAMIAQQSSMPDIMQMGQQLKAIKAAKPKSSPDIVEFETQTASKYLKWKGQLGVEDAVLVVNGGEIIKIVLREKVKIISTEQAALGTAKKIKLSLDGSSYDGKIYPDSLAKLTAWQGTEKEAELALQA